MKNLSFTFSIIIVLALTWHICLCVGMNGEKCIDSTSVETCRLRVGVEINPLTDAVTVKMPGAAAFGITDRTAAAGFNWGRDFTGVPEAEHHLNFYARQYFDLYAMILPYRARIVDQQQSVMTSASSPPPRLVQLEIRKHTTMLSATATQRDFRLTQTADLDSQSITHRPSLLTSLRSTGMG